MNPGLSFSSKFVLGSLGLAMLLMLALSFNNLLNLPLSTEVRTRGMGSGGQPAGAPGSEGPAPDFNISEEHMAEISELMATLKDKPNDADTLIALGETFLKAREWARAEVFLGRAVLSKPADIQPRYMLGIAQYQQGNLPEAIKTFEELLTIQEAPAAMYNLGIIYKYQAGNPKRAEELFKKAAASPDSDAEIIEKARKELE